MRNIKSDTIAAVLVFAFIFLFFGNLPANTVVIKNGSTLTAFQLETNTEGRPYAISSAVFTGTDVNTLRALHVPEDAWSLFANQEWWIWSSEASDLQVQNKRLQEELNAESEERSSAQNSFETYRLIFWVVLVFAAITILALAINLSSAKKDLRRARNSR
jgi:hypothetical protein